MEWDWVKIGSALFMLAMVIYLFPRAKHAVQNSRKAESGEWMNFALLMGGVVLFIIVLIALV